MLCDVLSSLVSFGWNSKNCQWCSETLKATESLEMGKKGIPNQPETVPVCVSPDLTGAQ